MKKSVGVGDRYARLVCIGKTGRASKHGALFFRFLCDCGNEVERQGWLVKRGDTKSCGCLHNESAGNRERTHGQSKTLVYRVYHTMINRCYEPKTASFPSYGGRGITVADRWRGHGGFENFAADMGPRPDGGTIERINNDGPYAPENCCWATRHAQAANKRNNRWLSANGVTKHLFEWARDLKVSPGAILARLKLGWSEERAVTEPAADRPNSKLKPSEVCQIREMYPSLSTSKLAAKFGVSKKTIHNVIHRKIFRDI